jgi:hypothetical protein
VLDSAQNYHLLANTSSSEVFLIRGHSFVGFDEFARSDFMNASRTCRSARALLTFATSLLLAVALQASDTQTSDVGKGFAFAYDSAKEITVEGTVQEVVTHPAPGSAVGIHLLISSEGKIVDAHLGPFVSAQNREALVLGQPVQIVGVSANVHGQDVILARQLIIGERQVTVRNQRGFLVRPVVRRAQMSKPAVNGGGQ